MGIIVEAGMIIRGMETHGERSSFPDYALLILMLSAGGLDARVPKASRKGSERNNDMRVAS